MNFLLCKPFWFKFSVVGLFGAFLVTSCFLFSPDVNAATYEVGADKEYATLEALRVAAANSEITWVDDDEIVLFGNDKSLTAAFDFNGKRITMSGSGTISPSAADIRFSSTSSPTSLKIVEDSSVIFDGFFNSTNGGAIYSDDSVTIFG
ncbi:MAG: hypothetical protein LBL62_03165, partial [Planctomycetaceae bacterium]|nr:hypothetical protein [Planctomycetaceae bacterium]